MTDDETADKEFDEIAELVRQAASKLEAINPADLSAELQEKFIEHSAVTEMLQCLVSEEFRETTRKEIARVGRSLESNEVFTLLSAHMAKKGLIT